MFAEDLSHTNQKPYTKLLKQSPQVNTFGLRFTVTDVATDNDLYAPNRRQPNNNNANRGRPGRGAVPNRGAPGTGAIPNRGAPGRGTVPNRGAPGRGVVLNRGVPGRGGPGRGAVPNIGAPGRGVPGRGVPPRGGVPRGAPRWGQGPCLVPARNLRGQFSLIFFFLR